MKKLTSRFEKLVFRLGGAKSSGTPKHAYHMDYESGEYRQRELVRVIRDALPHFALTPEEFAKYRSDDDVGEMYRTAWKRISKAKKEKKGDYGELLLFLLLRFFYKTERLVTKVKLRSSIKEQVKGFDCAHFSIDEDQTVKLWLGEVKFYKSFAKAVADIVSEIELHTSNDYLSNEFSILCPNIEYNANVEIPDEVVEYLDGTVPLDSVRIVIPALVTYDCTELGQHTSANQAFKDAITKDFEKRFALIDKKGISVPPNVEIFFLLLPLQDVDSIKTQLEQVEAANA